MCFKTFKIIAAYLALAVLIYVLLTEIIAAEGRRVSKEKCKQPNNCIGVKHD